MANAADDKRIHEVLVLVGAGGIGLAIARRLGAGKRVLLAGINEDRLQSDVVSLEADGYRVNAQRVDVALRESMRSLAQAAVELGSVVQVVDTAGLSPVQASPEAILAVDLVGTAIFLEEFGRIIAPGGSGLVISSMAGYMMPPLLPEQDRALAQTPTDQLLALPILSAAAVPNSGAAYAMAKRANHLPRPGSGRHMGRARSTRELDQPGNHHDSVGPGRDGWTRGRGLSANDRAIAGGSSGIYRRSRGGRGLPDGTRGRVYHRHRPALWTAALSQRSVLAGCT